jgi:gluconolactonase
VHDAPDITRRSLLCATGLAAFGGSALAQSFDFRPHQRYPDPAVQILDPSFAKYRLYSSTVEQLATGLRWAEGPVYFPGEGGGPGYLLLSDIPNNRIMKFDEKTGSFSVFRSPSNFANGNARDRQGGS